MEMIQVNIKTSINFIFRYIETNTNGSFEKERIYMDIEKALLITKDRIENMKQFIPSNPSEVRIKVETEEWLEFIEEMLEKEIKKHE